MFISLLVFPIVFLKNYSGKCTVKLVIKFKGNPQHIRELNIGEGYFYTSKQRPNHTTQMLAWNNTA